MIQYKQLGYIGISACDTAAWHTFAREYLGMQLVDGSISNANYQK